MESVEIDDYLRLMGEPNVVIGPIRPPISVETAKAVEKLHRQLFPDPQKTEFTLARCLEVFNNPDVTVLGAWLGTKLIGMATLYQIKTLSRTAILFEEFVVDSEARGKGVGQKMDAALIDYVKNYTAATRIEGTVNVENHNTWHVHMKSGFFDRKNNTILYVIKREQ